MGEERVKPLPQDQFQDPPRPDFNSQSEESPDSSDKEDMPRELEPVPQSTSLPFLSTSPLRSSSSQVTPPRTTRRAELCQDTSNSPSETMRSSTDSWPTPPSPPEVSSHPSTPSSSQRRTSQTRSESF